MLLCWCAIIGIVTHGLALHKVCKMLIQYCLIMYTVLSFKDKRCFNLLKAFQNVNTEDGVPLAKWQDEVFSNI